MKASISSHPPKATAQSGFSLIEVSLILLLLLIIAATLFTLGREEAARKPQQIMAHKLDRLSNALQRYARHHHRLPCPAGLQEDFSSNQFGNALENISPTFISCVENSLAGTYTIIDASGDINNQAYYGMVPVHTLGLTREDAIDAYGNRIAYAVSHVPVQNTDLYRITRDGGGQLQLESYQQSALEVQFYDPALGSLRDIGHQPSFILLSFGPDGVGGMPRLATADSSPNPLLVFDGVPIYHANDEQNHHLTSLLDAVFLRPGGHSDAGSDDLLYVPPAPACEALAAPTPLQFAFDARLCDQDPHSIQTYNMCNARGPLTDVDMMLSDNTTHQPGTRFLAQEAVRFDGADAGLEATIDLGGSLADPLNVMMVWHLANFGPDDPSDPFFAQQAFSYYNAAIPTQRSYIEMFFDTVSLTLYDDFYAGARMHAARSPTITHIPYNSYGFTDDDTAAGPGYTTALGHAYYGIFSTVMHAVDLAVSESTAIDPALLNTLRLGHVPLADVAWTTGFWHPYYTDTIQTQMHEFLVFPYDDPDRNEIISCYLAHKWR